VPNFTPPPPAAEAGASPVAAAGEESRGGLVPIPNAGKRRFVDDGPEGEDAPAVALSDPPEPDRAAKTDRVEPVPHVVQRGENFWSISRLYYGSGRFYMALWKANSAQVAAPDKLYRGTTIRIPPPEELDRTLVPPPESRRASRAAADPPTAPALLRRTSAPAGGGERAIAPLRRSSDVELALPIADPLADRDSPQPDAIDSAPEVRYRPSRPVYKVRKNETLRSIARDKLGDSHRADELLDLNRDVIDDPYHLTPGQLIELPDDARIGRRR
jgi:nucleoid-associated protein YgaU